MSLSRLRRAMLVRAASAAVALGAGLAAGPLAAQGSAPLRLVVPFSAGGAADAYARLLAQKLQEAAPGRQVLVDNKPGAGGVIGSDAVAKAAPDGQTLLVATVGHAVNPFILARLPYDTRRDFVPVGVIANVPSLVVTGPGFTGASLKDLLAQAKAQPGKLEYGSSGTGSTSHVAAALLESLAGVDLLHVPYKGAAPALQDVMAGRLALSIDILTSSLPLVKGGKLRALAITSARRSPLLPEVPTVAEAGLPGYEFTAWYLLLAPARTPAATLERLNAELRRVEALPEFRARLQDSGAEGLSLDLPQSAAFLDAEFAKWAAVVKARNIKAD
ncbi:tripartite tricarboxylate transporter substrate binding protein [Piscinibacter sakaiensis]|uniref:Putative exported protein n=1 Tax=Piscinibacter sakaiensis TaxID=1547922 RepID=A0A0K8P4N5_PISS1|nr:tripartite tricarboxylate transporter substrate binding protein [Piscinibacter sakaiensis]GAP37633.1 putative exported protein [Piscinibacter sakaiensis]